MDDALDIRAFSRNPALMDAWQTIQQLEHTLSLCEKSREINPIHSREILSANTGLQRKFTQWQTQPPEGATQDMLLDFVKAACGELRYSFMTHQVLLNSVALQLIDGAHTHAHYTLLVMCRAEAFRLALLPELRRDAVFKTTARQFYHVREYALAINLDKPLLNYSVHDVLTALYAVYVHTGEGTYHSQLWTYTEFLLTRLRTLLVTSAGFDVFNVVACRKRDDNRIHGVYYIRSIEFLTLARILDYSITRWFNTPTLAGRVEENPHSDFITKDRLRRVRAWLRRYGSKYVDQSTQMTTVAGLMRAGEMDLYKEMLPGAVVSEPDVMAYYRRPQFLRSTEQALWPVNQVIEDNLTNDVNFESSDDGHHYTQRERPQFYSAALSIVTSQLRMATMHINPEDLIICDDEKLRTRAHFLDANRVKWPVLVVCCNRLQVWHKGVLYMYNSVLDSLCVWFGIVENELNNRIGNYSVDKMIDQVMYADETQRETLERHNPQLKRSLGVDLSHNVASIHRPVRFEDSTDIAKNVGAERRYANSAAAAAAAFAPDDIIEID